MEGISACPDVMAGRLNTEGAGAKGTPNKNTVEIRPVP